MTIDVSLPARTDPVPTGSVPGVRGPFQDSVVARSSRPDFTDIVDEWGAQSFPASDPPSNW